MKGYTLLALIFTTFAAVPVDEQLAQIDSQDYGKQVLDTIDMELSSGASFDAIIELLNELDAELNADQAEDDRIHAERQQECEEEIAEFNRRIDTATSEITEAEKNLASLRPQYDTTVEQIATKESETESLSRDIANFKNAHSGDTSSYADRVAEHEAAIGAIDEAIIELSKLIGSEAGEGIHDNSVRIDAETKSGVFA
jgi:chromosome segregation ATPase